MQFSSTEVYNDPSDIQNKNSNLALKIFKLILQQITKAYLPLACIMDYMTSAQGHLTQHSALVCTLCSMPFGVRSMPNKHDTTPKTFPLFLGNLNPETGPAQGPAVSTNTLYNFPLGRTEMFRKEWTHSIYYNMYSAISSALPRAYGNLHISHAKEDLLESCQA